LTTSLSSRTRQPPVTLGSLLRRAFLDPAFEQRDPLSPATLDEHQADTFGEHVFVNVLSPWSSSVAP
jgi:hypothetical protein